MTSSRRSYEPNVEKLSAQPAGASGGGDLGEMHWWLPGITGCGAGVHEVFTDEIAKVSCSQCRAYLSARQRGKGRWESQAAARKRVF